MPGSLPLSTHLVVDNTKARVLSVDSSSVNGRYGLGERLLVHVDFSDEVAVPLDSEIALMLEVGGTDRLARYQGWLQDPPHSLEPSDPRTLNP